MTEPVVVSAPTVTELVDRLGVAGLGLESASGLASYLGSLTAQHLDAPEVETGAMLSGAAMHDLGWLRRIAVRGEDRLRWLSGMVTNAVETLPAGTGAYNLVLNAQGRIQGDGYLWRDTDALGGGLELEVTAEQAEALLGHFDRFIIMDDVELVAVTGESALGLTGPLAGEVLTKLGLVGLPEMLTGFAGAVAGIPVRVCRGYGVVFPHYALWVSVERIVELWEALRAAGAVAVGSAAVETLRVVEGIPAYGVDIQGRDLAQETSQERALSFTKGCYLGQEIVERIRSRGQVHRHLRALELTAENGELPAAGTELWIEGSMDGKAAGTLTSVAGLKVDGRLRMFGIGMVRAEAEIGGRRLMYAGGRAEVLRTAPKLT